ncbi:MAG: hypothetical protein HY376_03270 [Candidatus Blackburnbacteria bacterium]|nr:hypothetical protein [Candidatus Blackburnbacteria bacterium]
MKKKKIEWFVADTILTGDFSRMGKLHTIENVVRVAAIVFLFLGFMKANMFIILPAIMALGFVIRPSVDKNYQGEMELKLW